MSNHSGADPITRFSRVLVRLEDGGDHRGVIRLVERWAEHGSLTRDARLAQVRALLALRLMDRAWVRLREVLENDGEDREGQLLMAEMFIERGWPARARPVLAGIEAGEADGDRVHRLLEALEAPPLIPPDNAQEIERNGSAEDVLMLAERYLAAGSLVRAESLLERLLRDGFSPPRVSDLLWGIRGEFTSAKQGTEELLIELAPDGRLAEWEAVEATDSMQLPDPTAHVSPEELKAELEAASRADPDGSFPILFRREDQDPDGDHTEEEEVTLASAMASLDQLGSVPSDQRTDPDLTPGYGRGDTRIMEVITRGDRSALTPTTGPIHRHATGETTDQNPLGSTLDLRSFQESMGMKQEAFLEEEDQDLIIMTRREEPVVPPIVADGPKAPVQVVRRTLRARPVEFDRRPPESSPIEERADAIESRVKREVEQRADTDDRHDDPDTDEMFSPRRRGRRWGQLLIMGIALSLATGAGAWVVVTVLYRVAADQIREETHVALATADFRALQEVEAKLLGQVNADREPMAMRRAELALVRAVLWSDYTGDQERLVAIQDDLALLRESGGPEQEVALITGFLRLARGDVATARRMVNAVPLNDSLSRELSARVALASDDDEQMTAVWKRVAASTQLPPLREALTLEALAMRLGHVERSERIRNHLLESHGDNNLVQVARINEEWDGGSVMDRLIRLSETTESLSTPVAPRLEGRMHAQRALLLAEQGSVEMARVAWQNALVVDPTHAEYLYVAASDAMWNNHLMRAVDDLERCLESRAWDTGCRRGMIQVLIDLDRLATARQKVSAWAGATVLKAWVMLEEGEPADCLTHIEGETGSLAMAVRGMAQAALEQPEAQGTLTEAMEALSASTDPMDRIVAARAAIIRIRSAGRREARQIEQDALAIAPQDPILHTEVGLYHEKQGRRDDAAQAYDLSARVGPENARAHHARGLFYFEPKGNLHIARQAWRQYLELRPDGLRAERTRERLELR